VYLASQSRVTCILLLIAFALLVFFVLSPIGTSLFSFVVRLLLSRHLLLPAIICGITVKVVEVARRRFSGSSVASAAASLATSPRRNEIIALSQSFTDPNLIDPASCIVSGLDRGVAGEYLSFRITQRNHQGKTWIKPIGGWTVTIGGQTTIVPSITYDFSTHCYEVGFEPRQTGSYSVSVAFRGAPVAGSPFALRITEGPMAAPHSFVRMESCVIGIGDSFEMTVVGYDKLGNQVSSGGESHRLRCVCPQPEVDLVVEIVDEYNGTYKIRGRCTAATVFIPEVYFDDHKLGFEDSSGSVAKRLACRVFVLRDEEMESARQNAASTRIWYKSTLHAAGVVGKKVHVLLTETQVAVSESWLLGLIMKRLYSFRLRFSLLFEIDPVDPCVVTLSHYRERISLGFANKTDALSFVVTATLLLQTRLGANAFKRKRETFSEAMAKHNQTSKGQTTLKIDRSQLLKSSLKQLADMSKSSWRSSWKISFTGEEGLDVGGLTREFFTLLGDALFDISSPYWQRLDPDKHAVHPGSSPADQRNRHGAGLDFYRVCGMFVGKCMLVSAVEYGKEIYIATHFTRSMYKAMIGLPVEYSDFETDDPQFYNSTVNFMTKNSIDDAGLELVFAHEEVDEKGRTISTHELKPGGSSMEVTDDNKHEYLSLLSEYLLRGRYEREISSFLQGFYTLVPEDMASIFEESELELLICGLPEIDLADWREHCHYQDYSARSAPVQWFWVAVENMTHVERARLLHFITGSSQVPIGGFSRFVPPMSLARTYTGATSLPVAHTCFNRLDLPEYQSYEQLQAKLLFAVQEGAFGFGQA